jgi:hypothetical protein
MASPSAPDESACRRIEERDPPVGVDEDDRVADAVEGGDESCLGGFERHADAGQFVDVVRDPDDSDHGPVVVEHGRIEHPGMEHGAVGTDAAAVVAPHVTRRRGIELLTHSDAILGMHRGVEVHRTEAIPRHRRPRREGGVAGDESAVGRHHEHGIRALGEDDVERSPQKLAVALRVAHPDPPRFGYERSPGTRGSGNPDPATVAGCHHGRGWRPHPRSRPPSVARELP